MLFVVPRERQEVMNIVNAIFRELVATDLCGHNVICLPAGGTPEVTVSAVVSANDTADFPPL